MPYVFPRPTGRKILQADFSHLSHCHLVFNEIPKCVPAWPLGGRETSAVISLLPRDPWKPLGENQSNQSIHIQFGKQDIVLLLATRQLTFAHCFNFS